MVNTGNRYLNQIIFFLSNFMDDDVSYSNNLMWGRRRVLILGLKKEKLLVGSMVLLKLRGHHYDQNIKQVCYRLQNTSHSLFTK